jgi:hypothetical protein
MPKVVGDKLNGSVRKAFKGQWPRFAATVDDNGTPNVVPLLSAVAADEDTDFFQDQPYNRYNAYMGVTKVGVIKVKAVYEPWPLSFVSSLFKFAGLKGMASNSNDSGSLIEGKYKIPPEVIDKFNRALALKYISYIDDEGHPFCMPDFTMRLAEDARLLLAPFPNGHPLREMKQGMKTAAVVMTGGPVAYQVKGTYEGEKIQGNKPAVLVAVDRVYTASPPVPGKRVVPPELAP